MAVREELHPDLRELSISELVKRLAGDVGTLIRQEADLAKAEVAQKVKEASSAAVLFVGAAVLALLAAGALTACLIMLLALAIPAWVAALIVTLAYVAIAASLVTAGRHRLRDAAPPMPEATVQTLKEDVRWLKNPTG
jgi:uncharacterized membrane protein